MEGSLYGLIYYGYINFKEENELNLMQVTIAKINKYTEICRKTKQTHTKQISLEGILKFVLT